MTESAIEQRLRRGLAGAAATLPPKERAATRPPQKPARFAPRHAPERPGRRRRRWPAVVGVAAAATLIVGIAAAVMLPDRDEGPSVAVTDEPEDPDGPTTTAGPTTIPADQVRVTNGRVPGEAVAVDGEIRLYGPDGTQTGSVDLAPLTNISGASSDLNGGWVVCGNDGVRRFPDDIDEDLLPEGATPGLPDRLMWYPAEGEPVQLEDVVECYGGLEVIDSVYGPMVVRTVGWFGDEDAGLQGTVLATGETHTFPAGGSPFGWSATSNRLLQLGNMNAPGLHLYDLATGDELPIADIAVDWDFISMAPDATSVAVADGPVGGPVELVVYDLQTGNERYRDSFSLNAEGLQLSYDGVTVAIGSYLPDVGPVTVTDVESGAQHTIDAHGALL